MLDNEFVIYSLDGCDTLAGLLERLEEVSAKASEHANRPIHPHDILVDVKGTGAGTLFLISETGNDDKVTYVVQLR